MSTTARVGRNDPCPCGSGKKHKACCNLIVDRVQEEAPKSIAPMVGIVVTAALLAGTGIYFLKHREAPTTTASTATAAPKPAAPAGTTPETAVNLTPGAPTAPNSAPAPVVISQAPASAAPGALTPQPPGPVPPGKVWSPEHNHWHDAPGANAAPAIIGPVDTTQTAPNQVSFTPQPAGPVPPGKVWSTEHGHWHDVTTQP